MSVSGDDFIEIAKRVLATDDSEIGWRVSASRAYYGCFHCCLDIIERHPGIVVDKSYSTHERVYRAVNSMTISGQASSDLKHLVYLTKNLRDVRVDADYHANKEFTKERAEQALSQANNISNLRRKYRNDHGI